MTAVSEAGTTASVPTAVDQVTLTIENHVATVVIDRQHVLNAVDGGAQARLNEIWDQLEADPDVRAVVITGAGTRAFCVGADMSASAVDKTGLEYWAGLDPNGFGGLSLRTTLDIPVIARVNGYALGGGMEIVLGADIVIAADTARFGLTEPRVGRLALDGGIHQLVRRIPYTQAMGMLLTGRKAEATEMQSMGLVNEVVPADELDASVQRWVDQILACAPTSVRAVKQMVTQTAHLTATEARGLRLPALDPERVALVGVRSLDPGEQALVRDLGIAVYTISDLDRRGMESVITEALERVAGGAFVHVSIDLDVVDPEVAPGVGDPVRGGLSYREAHLALELVAEAGVMDALDIVEVNPIHDHENATAGVAVELAVSAFGGTIL